MEVRTVGCFGYVWDVGFFSSSSPVKSFFFLLFSFTCEEFFFLLFFFSCEEFFFSSLLRHLWRAQNKNSSFEMNLRFDKIYVWRRRYPVTSFANRQSAFGSLPSIMSNRRAMLPPPTTILPASLTSFSLSLALAVSTAWPGPQRRCQRLAYGDDFWLLRSDQLRSRDFQEAWSGGRRRAFLQVLCKSHWYLPDA